MPRRRGWCGRAGDAPTTLAAIALVTLVGCGGVTTSSVPPATRTLSAGPASPSVTPVPTPATLAWSRIRNAPISGDYYAPAQAVWDGDEMLVVISQLDPKTSCSETLLAYDPATDTWRNISQVPKPPGCFEGTDKAVWTGKELLLWGISNVAYDPRTDAWRKLPRPPAGAGGPSVVVWTGTQMIGWGGGCCEQELADGAAYTPATNSWRKLPPSPLLGRHASGVWTGTEMIVAGGEGYAGGVTTGANSAFVHFADAAAYNPAARTWRRLPPMPVARGGGYTHVTYATVWDGDEMLVVGGTPTGSDKPIARGVANDPSTNRWRWLPPMSYPRVSFVAGWAGNQLVVWGGVGAAHGSIPPSGETYDPVSNTWSRLPRSLLRARIEAVGVWTGETLIVFGGTDARAPDVGSLTDGAALQPA